MEIEKSEMLYQELKELEAQWPEIEAGELAAVNDPENQKLIARAGFAMDLFGPKDARVKKFQQDVEALKRAVKSPRLAYNEEHKRLCCGLQIVTGPAIVTGIETLQRRLRDLPGLEEHAIDTDGGGFSMIPKIIYTSNRAGILEVHKLVTDGVKALQEMSLRPLPEIQNFISERLAQIEAIDLLPRREVMTKDDWERRQFVERPRT